MKRIFILVFSLILFFSMIVNVYASEPNLTLADNDNATDASEKSQTNDENTGLMFSENLRKEDDSESGENDSDINDDLQGGIVYDIQKVKVVITKVVRNGDEVVPLVGCVLQIKDSEGNVIDSWTSDGKEHIIELPDGDYVIHEASAPPGYNLAEDVSFTVEVKIESIEAGTDVDPEPCDHYEDGQGNFGVVLYYVEIGGIKHEVYCINQSLGTPDSNSIYDGLILNPTNIKDYTVQTVYSDAYYNEETKDISDPTLDGGKLYNKFLDIIYHRYLAESEFPDLTETEIRYVTENALKNYSNTGLTVIQRIEKDKAPIDYDKYSSYEDGKYVWYLYPMYRSFVYLPDAELGEDIFTTVVGGSNANSFGNLARHWNSGHDAKNSKEVRKQVARYYELYNFLISEKNPHPDSMNLYIYSSDSIHYYEYHGNQYEEPYQNLLGITGYFETFEQEQQQYQIENTYSTETTDVTVKKEWDDHNNQDGIRPDKITVTLSNGESVELKEENHWTATISHLPKYDKGVEIEYTWKEIEVEGYESTKVEEGSVTTFTNYHKPEEVSITVKKEWDDYNNQDGIRPDKITVTLSNGESVELKEENHWTATISHLPKYDKGVEIEYTWKEIEVEGYESTKVEEGSVTTFTNYHKPEEVSIAVKKEWNDHNDQEGQRPESIIITLLADGEDYGEYEFTASEDWYHEFSELPKYKDGHMVQYSVLEKFVPGKYKVNYFTDYEDVLIIYNDLEIIPPHTGFHQNIGIGYYIMLFFMSISLIFSYKFYL